jgi:hypothetical protein
MKRSLLINACFIESEAEIGQIGAALLYPNQHCSFNYMFASIELRRPVELDAQVSYSHSRNVVQLRYKLLQRVCICKASHLTTWNGGTRRQRIYLSQVFKVNLKLWLLMKWKGG